MAEPLKNSFGPDIPVRIAEMVVAAHPPFDTDSFLSEALSGYEAMELTARARHISAALRSHLPDDAEQAIGILVRSLGSEIEAAELTGMGSFIYLPHVFFVADYGLDCFETSMAAQYELTKRFTAEFSIRAYLERHPRADARATDGMDAGPQRSRPTASYRRARDLDCLGRHGSANSRGIRPRSSSSSSG